MAFLIFTAFLAYLGWSLVRGRITFIGVSVGQDPVVSVDRDANPTLFWASWGGAFVGLCAMVIAFTAA